MYCWGYHRGERVFVLNEICGTRLDRTILITVENTQRTVFVLLIGGHRYSL